MLKIKLLIILGISLFFFAGCDKTRVFEDHSSAPENGWKHQEIAQFDVDISDTSQLYNIVLHLRHVGSYRYSNLYVLLNSETPSGKTNSTRFEFKLAEKDGRWLGNGSGNIFSSSIPVNVKTKFPEKGLYKFGIEQYMRDSTLKGVKDVGLRVELAK
ncbi:MAG: gliding motility-associated lipoprotein GldH [Sphingobacteriales bacterium]|jgi:gliding motility-associated lipoprotein GldH